MDDVRTDQVAKLIIGIEQRLPWWQNLMYGFQQLTVDTTILIVPILLARALQLPPETSGMMVQAALIGAGLVTIGQALWILKLPVLQGPAIVFVSVVPAVVAVSGLAAAWTGLVISSAIAAVLSLFGMWGRLRAIFGAAPVYGVVILLVAVIVSGTLAGQVTGLPNTPTFALPSNFLLAGIPVIAAMLVVLLIPSSFLRLASLLFGAVLAVVVALALGRMNFAAVANAPWFGFSLLFPFGFQFDLGTTIVMLIAFIADLAQVIGSYVLVGEVIGKQQVSAKRIDGGVLTESIGSVISSALGGLPTVTYNQNIGALMVTGIGSRFVFATAGAILVVLGLSPKIGAVIASIPGPVVAGLLVVTIAMLGMQAIRVLGTMPQTNANLFAAGIGIVVGVGVTVLPRDLLMMLPQLFRPFVSSGIIMGFLVAAIIHTVFNVVLKLDGAGAETPPATSTTGKASGRQGGDD